MKSTAAKDWMEIELDLKILNSGEIATKPTLPFNHARILDDVR